MDNKDYIEDAEKPRMPLDKNEATLIYHSKEENQRENHYTHAFIYAASWQITVIVVINSRV